jgi:hypothetical protein
VFFSRNIRAFSLSFGTGFWHKDDLEVPQSPAIPRAVIVWVAFLAP